MTTKLHEILSIEGMLDKTAKKLVQSSKKQFGKENLFNGQTRKLEMFDEKDARLNVSETMKLETTVDKNLNYALKAVSKYWDAVVQKDAANQEAKADVTVGGAVILKDVPSTTLLGLETKVSELRSLFESIPTLPTGINWERNEADEPGIYRTREDVKQAKTENDVGFRVLYEATKEHPAQIEKFKVVNTIGMYSTSRVSSMYTAHFKAKMLENIDTLIAAIKKARQRANTVNIDTTKHIGDSLINFITTN